MPKTRVQKELTVQKLTDKLNRANSVVFTDYQGLNMAQLSELREKLQEVGAEFTITKNNLLKIAAKEAELNQIDPNMFEGPTATLFSYDDELSSLKILTKALKDFSKGSVKSGVLEGEVLDAFKIQTLAALPSKDELRAKVVGSLGAPLYGIVGVLQANIRNLVYALDQVRVLRGGE